MRKFPLRPLIVLVLLAALLPPPAEALRENLGPELAVDIHVGLSDRVAPGGMIPIVCMFENTGDPRSVQVRTSPGVQVGATFSVPPGRAVKRCLYVPLAGGTATGISHLNFTDAATRELLAEVELWNALSSLSYPGGPLSSVPFPARFRSATGRGGTLAGISVSGRRSFAVNEKLDGAFDLATKKVSASLLPDNWVGYTCLHLVVLDYESWNSPSFHREPLAHWMAMGGVCLMVDAPAAAKSRLRDRLRESAPFVGEWQAGPDALPVGLGGVVMVDEQELTRAHREFFPDSIRPQVSRMPSSFDSPDIGGVGGVPFWPILVLLTVFAALVGPLGWWYVVGRKQMGLLYYVAAPSLSLCVIVLMVVADVFHEGVVPRLSCVGVRLLDQRARKAIDLSQFGVYAPFLLTGDLEGSAAEVPHFLSRSGNRNRWNAAEAEFSVVQAGDRRTYSGLLPAREKTWFGREAVGLERKRLMVWMEEGKVAVENHLGCDLEDLSVRCRGNYAEFASLPAGEKKTAEPLGDPRSDREIPPPDRRLTGRLMGTIPARARDLVERLSDGEQNVYAAELSGCTGQFVWLDSFRPSGISALIIGVF